MNTEIIESLQLLLIINKETDSVLLQNVIDKLKNINLYTTKTFDNPSEGICLKNVIFHLKLLRLHVSSNDNDDDDENIDENKFNEQELQNPPTLYNSKIESYEHEQIKEILFLLLELLWFNSKKLSQPF